VMKQIEKSRMDRRIFCIFMAGDHLPASRSWQAAAG
jgi:hypothetical protein